MKLKKIIKFFVIFFIILVLLFTGYFIWYKTIEIKEDAFISSDFLFVFQTENLFTLFNTLNETRMVNTIFYNKEMKNFYQVLMDIRTQMSQTKKSILNFIDFPATVLIPNNKKPVVIFNTGIKTPLFNLTSVAMKSLFSESLDVRFKQETYSSYILNKVILLSKRESFYFVQIKNMLIISIERSSLTKLIDTYTSGVNLVENENYLQVKSQIRSGRLLSVFFNISHILEEVKNTDIKLYKSLKTLSILSIAGFDLDIEQGSIRLLGFYSTELKNTKVNKLFLSSPKRIEALKILPQRTDSFISLTFDNFQDVWNYYKIILRKTGQKDKYKKLVQTEDSISKLLGLSLNDLIFSWLSDEMTYCHMSGFQDPLTIIAIKNKRNVDKAIKHLQEKNILNKFTSEKYKNNYIYKVQLSSFFKFLSDFLSPDLSLPFYTIHDDFLILSMNREVIKSFIDSLQKDELLYYQDHIKKLHSTIKEGNVMTYWDLSKGSIPLLSTKNLFTKIIKQYQYGMLSLEFSDKGIRNRIFITELFKEDIKLVDGWPVQFDSTIWQTPIPANIDSSSLDEVIVASEDGKIYLLDFFGETKANWPVKLDGKLATSPFIIRDDNGVILISAISSAGKIYAWNKEGILHEGYPKEIKGDVYNSPVLTDINRDQSPDILVSNDQGDIYALNHKAEPLPGFPVEIKEKGPSEIFTYFSSLSKKTEIVCSSYSRNGSIYFINSNGVIDEENIFAAGDMKKATTSLGLLRKGEFIVVQITDNGKLFARKRDGSFLENFPLNLDERYVNPPAIVDINSDQKSEIIILSAIGNLKIINSKAQVVSEYQLNFRPVENERMLLFDINKDGKSEIIITDTKDQIRFYNLNGELMFKLTGSTTPIVKDMDKDGKYEMLTAGYDQKVYLYKFPY